MMGLDPVCGFFYSPPRRGIVLTGREHRAALGRNQKTKSNFPRITLKPINRKSCLRHSSLHRAEELPTSGNDAVSSNYPKWSDRHCHLSFLIEIPYDL